MFSAHADPASRVLASLLTCLCLSACGGGGDDDPNNGWVCVGGCPAQGVTAIDDDVKAKNFAGAIAGVAGANIPAGTYTDRLVNGASGTATISGRSISSSTSCGTDCLSRKQDTDVTIVFDAFRARYGSNVEVTVTGTARFTDNQASRQSGTSFSSSGGMSLSSSRLVGTVLITDSSGRVYGQTDTAELATTSASGSNWKGSLRPANGIVYRF